MRTNLSANVNMKISQTAERQTVSKLSMPIIFDANMKLEGHWVADEGNNGRLVPSITSSRL